MENSPPAMVGVRRGAVRSPPLLAISLWGTRYLHSIGCLCSNVIKPSIREENQQPKNKIDYAQHSAVVEAESLPLIGPTLDYLIAAGTQLNSLCYFYIVLNLK